MSDEARLRYKWQKLIDEEEKQFEEICRSTKQVVDSETHHKARTYWSALSAVLAGYQLRLVRHSRFCEPIPILPIPLIDRLCGLTGALAVGNVPKLAAIVAERGNPKPGPAEVNCIRLAVSYRRACEHGGLIGPDGATILVPDHKPVATLCDWFGVKRTTVQGWISTYEPADLGVTTPRKSSSDVGEDPKWSAEARGLVFQVNAAGQHYKTLSRSAEAISQRAAKRPPTKG